MDMRFTLPNDEATRLVEGLHHAIFRGELTTVAEVRAYMEGFVDSSEHRAVSDEVATEATQIGACSEWLTERLTGWPPEASRVIKDEAKAQGFGDRTITRAAKRIGVNIQRTPTSPPTTLWYLPYGSRNGG